MMSAQKAIKAIRMNLLLEQSEFAERLGISQGSICNYESGKRKPSLPIIRKIKELAEQNNITFNINDFVDYKNA